MKSIPIHVKLLVTILIAMLVISVNNTFANRDGYDNLITKEEFEKFSKDVEVGLAQLDLLVKNPPLPYSDVDEIKRTARDKKLDYINFKSENKLSQEIAAIMASGFSMLERSLNEYKKSTGDASFDYTESRDSFNEVLRILNRIHNNVV